MKMKHYSLVGACALLGAVYVQAEREEGVRPKGLGSKLISKTKAYDTGENPHDDGYMDLWSIAMTNHLAYDIDWHEKLPFDSGTHQDKEPSKCEAILNSDPDPKKAFCTLVQKCLVAREKVLVEMKEKCFFTCAKIDRMVPGDIDCDDFTYKKAQFEFRYNNQNYAKLVAFPEICNLRKKDPVCETVNESFEVGWRWRDQEKKIFELGKWYERIPGDFFAPPESGMTSHIAWADESGDHKQCNKLLLREHKVWGKCYAMRMCFPPKGTATIITRDLCPQTCQNILNWYPTGYCDTYMDKKRLGLDLDDPKSLDPLTRDNSYTRSPKEGRFFDYYPNFEAKNEMAPFKAGEGKVHWEDRKAMKGKHFLCYPKNKPDHRTINLRKCIEVQNYRHWNH